MGSFLPEQKVVEQKERNLMGEGVVIRIRRFLAQIPLGTWLGYGTQPYSKAPSDL